MLTVFSVLANRRALQRVAHQKASTAREDIPITNHSNTPDFKMSLPKPVHKVTYGGDDEEPEVRKDPCFTRRHKVS